MKRIAFVLCMLSFAACNNSSKPEEVKADTSLLSTDLVTNPNSAMGTDEATMGEMPTMDFKDTAHSFGNLQEGEVGMYDFEFVNHGKKPLIISSASGSCGCTVPEYPHQPIAPGKTGVMRVKFDSEGKAGHQEKSVTINTNSTRGTHMLFIKAEVEGRDSR